jgi:hypothetical protein
MEKINGRTIEIGEKGMRILRNNEEDEHYVQMQKCYGAQRLVQERMKVRDEIEATNEFKELINKFKSEGKTVSRIIMESDEDFDRFIQTYRIK